jgi:PEGA domain-containing protein
MVAAVQRTLSRWRRAVLAIAAPLGIALALLSPPVYAGGRAGDGDGTVTGKSDGLVAIVAVDITGDAAPELRAQVESAVVRGIENAGSRAMTLAEVRAATAKEAALAGCTSTACLERVSAVTGAHRFLRARVDASGASYDLVLEVLRADIEGAVERRRQESCPVCTVTELTDSVSKLAAELVQAPSDQQSPVEISTSPAGARLRVDGADVGPSPWTGSLTVGSHAVEASLEGHAVARQTVDVSPDQKGEQRVSVTLIPLGGTTGRPYRWIKWGTAAAAGGAIIGGILLISRDGNGTCDRGPPAQCEEVYDTLGVGVGLLLGGVALGGGSTWMFLRDRAATEEAPVAVVPTPGGAIGTLSLRF